MKKKKSFSIRVLSSPLQKMASGAVLTIAIGASIASNPPAISVCGDGNTLDGDTENLCDDGNTRSGDGCSKICEVEPGYECTDPYEQSLSICKPAECGNGISFTGFSGTLEECDDGPLNSDTTPNACRADCTKPECGDGVIDNAFGEACDDGAENSDVAPNACRTGCEVPSCGDGVNDLGEECDDRNNEADDGCGPTCALEVCGDGIAQISEACDDGNTNDGDGCSSACVIELCGDGILNNNPDPNNPNEECDDGPNNQDNVPDACHVGCIAPRCGDGIKDSGEGCDLGALNSDTFANACREDCTPPVCGDGIVDDLFGEQCDDGNTDDTDSCKNDCTF